MGVDEGVNTPFALDSFPKKRIIDKSQILIFSSIQKQPQSSPYRQNIRLNQVFFFYEKPVGVDQLLNFSRQIELNLSVISYGNFCPPRLLKKPCSEVSFDGVECIVELLNFC